MSVGDERDEIRRKIDIVDLVSSRVQLKRAGKNYIGLCPFHEDKRPSFNVSPLIGRYKCWSCGASGDVFNWVMETQKVDFSEALRILAAQAGVTLSRQPGKKLDAGFAEAMADALDFFLAQMRLSKDAQAYCDNRGLTAEVRDRWEIGYAPDVGDALARALQKKGHSLAQCEELFLVKHDSSGGFFDQFRGRMMVPIRDERGALVAYGGRAVLPGQQPKYVNSSDTPLFHKSHLLFGMDKAKESIAKRRAAVLAEGYLDVVACHQAGVNQAVASLGTSLTEEQVKLLKRWCDHVVVMYDGDTAGQNATERAADLLEAGGLTVSVAPLDEGEDPDTLLRKQGAAAVQAAVAKAVPILDFRAKLLRLRHQVTEPDYWSRVAQLLAKAPNDLEFLRLAPSFAAEYPGTRDKEAAVKALRKMAADAKRGQPAAEPRDTGPRRAVGRTGLKLSGPETVLFGALADPRYHATARAKLADPINRTTPDGERLAVALAVVFETHQDPDPRTWVSALEEADLRDGLSEILSGAGMASQEAIEEACDRLKREAETRQAKALAERAEGDDDLRKLTEQMRQIKDREKK